MLAPWVVEEMKTADLNDQRLNERLLMVLDQLASHPTASIPAACGGYAETVAAYRLFDNEKATFAKVLAPHIDATRRRIAGQSVVLLAQDTTEIDLTRPEQEVFGAGPLDGSSRRGAFLHLLHAFTPNGTALGTLHAQHWTREDEPPLSAEEREARKKHTPIEEKESYRWVTTLEHAQAEAARNPNTQFVCLADSEADIYELMITGMAEPRTADWIVRACQDRASQAAEDDDSRTTAHLRTTSGDSRLVHEYDYRSRSEGESCVRPARPPSAARGRKAEVEVRATSITLRPPWRFDHKLPPVTINVVLVREIDPPAGEEPVEWVLLTSLPIETPEQVRLIVQYYTVRWMVEILFRVLKSGCRVEERLFEHIDRLLTCLAVYLIVAWRTLYVCRLGREFPEISCEAVFEPAEWKAVYHLVHRQPPPRDPPKLVEMVRLVAQLGGYVNRKRNDPPGPQTVWLGLQRLHDITLCYQTFGPDG